MPNLLFIFLLQAALTAAAENSVPLEIDFRTPAGVVRPLHGINKGPIASGGLIDLTESLRAIGTPFIRLHDCQWPYPDVIDMHAIFPNPEADPTLPASYEFRLTDEYLGASVKTGARIIYRLGESIEHGAVKRYVHPPRDPGRWAAACLGIIRHYNAGWANGFHHRIEYWEIWNEPENRPAMWTGSDEQYFELYRTTAQAIRKEFPHLKIGGPAVGYSGKFADGRFVPGEFVTRFLTFCRQEALPLDFFSWHCYTDSPQELTLRAKAIRELLDRFGFVKTENHLNEWNYLPGNSWAGLEKSAAPAARENFYREMAGPAGAAFVAAALIELQDAPVTVANFFHGELGGFGLFNEHGVPNQIYFAMEAFNQVSKLKHRAKVTGPSATLAAIDSAKKQACILISQLAPKFETQRLIVRNHAGASGQFEIRQLSETKPWTAVQKSEFKGDLEIVLKTDSPAVTQIQIFFQ